MKQFLHWNWLILLIVSPFLSSSVFGQSQYSGKVISEDDKLGLPGVTVKVKGTSQGTLTNAEGRFSVAAPQGATLVFSLIGYSEAQIFTGPNREINLSLRSSNKVLLEVVVTALGIRRERKTLSYSVGEVKSDQITNNTNAFSAIEGKVAGLQINSSGGQVGASANILIRGTSSITGNNQALIVVDGVPIDNSKNPTEVTTGGAPSPNRAIDIDPSEIESVSVLKGGAAVALYGLQGSNGVMVITTKKGQKGKTKIEVSSSVAFDKVNRLPFFQNVYAQGSNGVYAGPEKSQTRSWGPRLTDLRYNGDATYPFDKNGKLVLATDPTAMSKPANRYDNVGSFFKTGATYNNNIALSGGSENATFRVSAGVEKQNGIVPTTYFQRINLKTSGEATVFKDMKVSGDMSYINSVGNFAQQGSNISGVFLPLYRTPISFDDKNGTTNARDQSAFLFPDGTQRDYTGGVFNNPYFALNKDPFNNEVNRFIGDVNLTYNPLKWFGFNYRLGGDVYSDNRIQKFEIGDASNNTGRIISDNYLSKIINSDIQVNFKHDIAPNLSANFLLGSGLYSRYLNELGTVGTNLIIPGFVSLNNAASISGLGGLPQYLNVVHRLSFYGVLNLAWKDQLFLDASYRVDKSTALNPQNNSFQNPAAGLSWVFSELPGLKDNSVLSFGKLRASFATAGNDAPAFQLGNTFSPQAYGDGLTNGIVFPYLGSVGGYAVNGNLGNPLLRAEKTFTYEFGGELSFFKDRLTIDGTYYDKEGTDLIINVPLASSTGFGAKTLNVAEMSNKGIEFSLNAVPVKVAGFQWAIGGTFAKNVNKVKKLGVDQVSFGGFTGITVAAIQGYPNQSFFGPKFVTDPKSGQQVIDDNSQIVNGKQQNPNYGYPIAGQASQYVANALPKWLMGITNTFTYKGVRVYALLDIRHGGSLWNGTEGALISYGRSDVTLNRNTTTVFPGVTGHPDASGKLVIDGAVNTAPATLNQAWYRGNGGGFGSVASQFVQDGSWVRLREVNLSYSVNKAWFKSGAVKGIDVGLFGRNLWLHTKYHGQDPETSLQGSGNAQGLDYFQTPGTKTYGINLKVTL